MPEMLPAQSVLDLRKEGLRFSKATALLMTKAICADSKKQKTDLAMKAIRDYSDREQGKWVNGRLYAVVTGGGKTLCWTGTDFVVGNLATARLLHG